MCLDWRFPACAAALEVQSEQLRACCCCHRLWRMSQFGISFRVFLPVLASSHYERTRFSKKSNKMRAWWRFSIGTGRAGHTSRRGILQEGNNGKTNEEKLRMTLTTWMNWNQYKRAIGSSGKQQNEGVAAASKWNRQSGTSKISITRYRVKTATTEWCGTQTKMH